MGDDLPVSKVDQALDAVGKCGRILHVQPSWIQGVPGEQNAGLPIVNGNRRGFMTGNWNDIQNAVAEIVRDDLGWPAPKTKESLHGNGLWIDHRGVGKGFQIRIARSMIAMGVRMSY